MNVSKFLAHCSLLVLGLIAAIVAHADAVLPEVLFPGLDAVLKKAVSQSPQMLNRSLNLEIAEDVRIQARANLLPSLGGYASYYQSQDTRADLVEPVDVTKVAYNFSISQPLFHWGERRNYARIGAIQQSISQGQYRDGYRQFAQTLRDAYLQLIVQKLAVKRAEFYLDYAKKLLAQEEIRLAQKVVSDAQIFSTRLTAEQAQIARDRALFGFEQAKGSFARLSGGPLLEDNEIPDAIPAVGYDPAEMQQRLAEFLAQKEVPTTAAVNQRHQIEINQLSYANAKTRLLPKLNAVVGVSQDEQNYTINVAQKYKVNSLYGGVSLSWSIFDGFSAGAAKRIALRQLRQAENDYRALTEQLAEQARTHAKLLGFSRREMKISNEALVTAVGNLKSKQDEFARGVISEADVTMVQLAVYDAQLSAFSARSNFLGLVTAFLGTIEEDPVVANAPVN